MSYKMNLTNNKTASIINKCILVLLSVFLFIAPFTRGMYFEANQFVMYSFIFPAGIVYCVCSAIAGKKYKINIADLCFLGMLVLYYLSIVWSVDTRQALSEALKYTNCFVFYFIIKNEIADYKKGTLWFAILIETILVGISLVGLFSAMGANIPGAFSLAEGWINSTLQYHNAFGAVSLAGLCIAIALSPLCKKVYFKILNTVSTTILLYGLFFSNSRGAWVMAPIVFIVLLVYMFKDNLYEYITYILTIVAGALFLKGFWTGVLDENWFECATYLFASCLLAVVINLVMLKLSDILRKKSFNIKKWFVVILIAFIAVSVIVAVFAPSIIAKIIPENILSRLKDISFTTGTVTERFVFYKDATNIIASYPVLGAGGGSWNALYKVYASYNYSTTEPHSFIIKTLVETGLAGLLLLLTALLFVFIYALKSIKNKENKKTDLPLLAIFTALLAILLHSLIDFDLSISAVAMIVIAICAVISALTKGKELSFSGYINTLTVIVLGVALVLTTLFNLGLSYEKKGQLAYNEGNKDAVTYFEKAVKLDPTNSVYRTNYLTAFMSKGSATATYDETIGHIESAIKYDRYDVDLNYFASKYYQQVKDYNSAIYHADATVKLRPFDADTINASVMLYSSIRTVASNAKDYEAVKLINSKIIELVDSVEEKNKQLETHGQDKIVINDKALMYYNAAVSMNNN